MSLRPRRFPRDDVELLATGGSGYSHSLVRGLSILRRFSLECPVLGIADIADSLGMSRSTAHRYVVTLAALGYLEQLADRRYRLGLRVLDLGMSVLSSSRLVDRVSPGLWELRRRIGYTVSLAVLDGAEVLVVDRVRGVKRGQYEIDQGVSTGSRLPVYCTATGKVLLAGLPAGDLNEVLYEVDLKRRGPNTITRKKALRAELERVAEDGLAVDDQEFREGLVAIATAVRDQGRAVVAALGVEAHASVISKEGMIDGLASHLSSAAAQVSARLGYRRDDEIGGR